MGYRDSKTRRGDGGLFANGRPVLPTTDTGHKSYGLGRLFLPAATNYCTNPGCAGAVTGDVPAGWAGTGNQVTRWACERVAGVYGQYAYHFTGTAEVGKYGATSVANLDDLAAAFSNGDPITCSAIVYGPTIPPGLTVSVHVYAAAYADAGVGHTNVAGAGRYSVTAVITDVPFKIYTDIGSVAPWADNYPVDFYVEQVSIVKSSVLTPHFDGNTAGCSWSGTANASASVRAASSLIYADSVLASMFSSATTIAARVVPLFDGALGTGTHFLAQIEDEDRSEIVLLYHDNSGMWNFRTGAASAYAGLAEGTEFAAGSVHHIVVRQEAGVSYDLNHDGTDAAQVVSGVKSPGAMTKLLIGSRDDYAGHEAYAYIGPVLISPQRKSDAWTAAIQANDGAAFSDPLRLWREFMEPGDMLIPLINDSIGYVKVAGEMSSVFPAWDVIVEATSNSYVHATGLDIAVTHGLTIPEGALVLAFVHTDTSGVNSVVDNNGANAFVRDRAAAAGSGASYSYGALFSRIAGASEPAVYHFTQVESYAATVLIRVFTGIDKASYWDVAPPVAATGQSATATAAAITIATPGALGIFWAGVDASSASISGATNGFGNSVVKVAGRCQGTWTKLGLSTGATGTAAVTITSDDWFALLCALKPAVK